MLIETKEVIQYLLSLNNLFSFRFAYYVSIIFELNDINVNDLILANMLYRFDKYLKSPKEKQSLLYTEYIRRMLCICDILKFEDERINSVKRSVITVEGCNIIDKCPYCDVDVPLTQFSNFSCSNSHPMVRCLNSFKILSEYDGLICSICGTEYNNVNNDEIESCLGNLKNGNILVCVLCGNILRKDV